MSGDVVSDWPRFMAGELRPEHLRHAPDRALALAKAAMHEPAYTDTKHRGHEQLHRDVRALYEVAVPDREGDDDAVLINGQFFNLNRPAGQR